MTQLVYVHGVSVRNQPNDQNNQANDQIYQAVVERRHKAFQEMGFGGEAVSFYDPYWGAYGAPAEYQSIEPDGDIWLAFSALEDFTGISTPLSRDDLASTTLRDAAENDFAATVNSLSIILSDPSNPAGDPELALLLADYLVALEDAKGVLTTPSWMNAPQPSDDEEFLDRLERAVCPADIQALRLGEALKKAGRWLLGKGIGLIDGPAARLVRRLTPAMAMFLGRSEERRVGKEC
jgi:hypothetical protein